MLIPETLPFILTRRTLPPSIPSTSASTLSPSWRSRDLRSLSLNSFAMLEDEVEKAEEALLSTCWAVSIEYRGKVGYETSGLRIEADTGLNKRSGIMKSRGMEGSEASTRPSVTNEQLLCCGGREERDARVIELDLLGKMSRCLNHLIVYRSSCNRPFSTIPLTGISSSNASSTFAGSFRPHQQWWGKAPANQEAAVSKGIAN